MFFAPLIFYLIPLVAALAISRHPALGSYRNSALNPLLLLVAFMLVSAIDFGLIAAEGYGVLGQHVISVPTGKLLAATIEQVVLICFFLAGIAVVLSLPQRRAPASAGPISADMRIVLMGAYLAILLAWFVTFAAFAGNVLSLSSFAVTRLEARDDVGIFLFSMLLLPALCYALCRQPLKVAVPVVLISIALLLVGGSRTRVLFVLIPFAFYLVRVRGVQLRRQWFWIGVVLLGFLAIIALNLRLVEVRGQTASASNVLDVSNVFHYNDLAIAETNIALSRQQTRRERYPGENFVGFAFALVPRSIVPFKPATGSIEFTQQFDPYRWRTFQSGLVIGGINEVQYDYPRPLNAIIMGLLGAIWAFAFLRATSSKTVHGFAWTVGLYVSLYTFLRGDLQMVGQIVTIFVVYSAVIAGYRAVTGRSAKLRPAVRTVARPQAALR